ncbi:MAG: DUF1329 domain-containing protein [Thermodesulfobacteriota bacterium]|nr:DUF1329 domain-containing protein [Thermodesulfobacteriota bacterium]
MKSLKMKNHFGLVMLIALFLVFPGHGVLNAADVPTVYDVIKGKADLPTIEDLTAGKVKIGDLIDKNNVDSVKEYLGKGIYESVKRGMILRMAPQLPPDQIGPKFFRDATERNRGKAIIDENGTVYHEKMGTLWPGGLPFPEPKTGLEVAANVKYGCVWDELRNFPNTMIYVDSKGHAYKKVGMDQRYVYCTTRTKLPPLGAIAGYEDIMFKRLIITTFPLELKGLGQYTVRYYDDSKTYDTGFAYLPAFKRTIRVSATIWQDNIAGSDLTSGDGQGLQEPYSSWDFKLLETKYTLLVEPKTPFPLLDKKGNIDKRVQFDVGEKFPRLGWTIWPVHVLEATPRIKHVYGKKILYTNAWPYWPSSVQFALTEMYDRQMKLWKVYPSNKGYYYILDGEPYTSEWGLFIYDLQSDHITQYWYISNLNGQNYVPDDITLKTLLEVGR